MDKLIDTRIKGLLGLIALRNLIFVIIIGGFIGLLVSTIFPRKTGTSRDIMLGILGAFLGNIFLSIVRSGVPQVKLGGLIIVQIIGAILIISLGRLISRNN